MRWLQPAIILIGISWACGASIDNGTYSENSDEHTNIQIIPYKPREESQPPTPMAEPSENCKRKCVAGETKTCEYTFKMEWYGTLTKACFECLTNPADCSRPDCIPANGEQRSVLVVNRQLPGPAIEVCFGDTVIVDVQNALMGESTSIHWHGLHQKKTPYMDGVPLVSQCPIGPVNTFRYEFSADNAGTHFWHSHSNMQRGDGAFGTFVVRVPDEDNAHKDLYDEDDSILLIIDWSNDIGINKYIFNHQMGISAANKPTNILVNGVGINAAATNPQIVVPLSRFTVTKGKRYRFRSIHAGFLNCPVEISIDNHKLIAISTDGNDFEPVEVDTIILNAGERFDFVVNADQTEDVYWIKFRGLSDCGIPKAYQLAILDYKGDGSVPAGDLPKYEDTQRIGKQMNPVNLGTESDANVVTLPQLHALAEDKDNALQAEPDEQHYVAYDFYDINNPLMHKGPYYGFYDVNKNERVYTPQMNHISMQLLPFPLMPARHLIDDSLLCNETTIRDTRCNDDYCKCPHVIQVGLNKIIEIILVDEASPFDVNHPFHLHGHAFKVVGMERVGTQDFSVETVKKMDAAGQIKRNLVNAIGKDTLATPGKGYTVLRFNATNPGYWLLHCHIEFHVELGMALLFKVGEHDDIAPVPKDFPVCGSYGNTYVRDAANELKSLPVIFLAALIASIKLL